MKLKMTKKKLLAAILSTALVCGVGVGGTVAWLHDSAWVTNEFSLANVEGSIDEEFDDKTIKENVKFGNTGDVDAYVRAVISISFVNSDGTTIANLTPQRGVNYEVTMGSNKWIQGFDGLWYYTESVPAKVGNDVSYTEILIDNIKPIGDNNGLKLRVDVSAQMIQAEPADAVEEAWGVEVDEETGNLIVNS